MNIGILTYYNVHNHGALLQAYALQTVLENMGNTVEFLTFNRNYDYIPAGNEKKYQLSPSSIPFFLKYLKKNGAGTFYYNYLKRKGLNKFRGISLKIGARYSDSQADTVIVGSDEVFSADVGVNPFFYGHCLGKKRVFSYAASFGQTDTELIDRIGCRELISSGLNTMTAVGVRDENSYNTAAALSDKTPELLCDPVLLYGYEKELKDMDCRVGEKPYILVYSYDKNMNDSGEVGKIKAFARQRGFEIHSVGYYHKWCDKNMSVSPIELLRRFNNAEFVITETFHGSVLSITVNAPFAAMLRGNGNKLEFLLKQHGLSDRIISDFSELERVFGEKIDFNAVNDIVLQNRKKAIEFLNRNLKEDSDD